MGSSQSTEDDVSFALPQQQIVSVIDGQATTVTGSSDATGGPPTRVGSSKQAHAVRAPFTISRGGVRLDAHGTVIVEVNASVSGVVQLLAPALEFASEAGTVAPFDVGALGAIQAETDVSWPVVVVDGTSPISSRAISPGEKRELRFDGRGESLSEQARQDAGMKRRGDGSRLWPLVLVIFPCSSTSEIQAGVTDNPPDGALMMCCVVQKREVVIARQLIAWGGNRSAYVLKEIFGLQEAQQVSASANAEDTVEEDAQKNCVVCLSSPKNTALVPCGHFCVCYDCGASIRLSPVRNRCPLCRQDVHDIVQLEVASKDPTVHAASSGSFAPRNDAADVITESNSVAVGSARSEDIAEVPTASADPAPCRQGGPLAAEAPQADATANEHSPESLRAARLRALERNGVLASGSSGAAAEPSAPTESPKDTADEVRAASSVPSADECTLPPKCLQRLTREMRQMETQRSKILAEHGIELALCDPEGNNLRVWSLKINSVAVDAACTLGKELRKYGVPCIEFEVWIPDAFPVAPPKVRVLRPSFGGGSFYVHQNGALCLEILTRQGWSPAMSLVQLGVQIKTMMSQTPGHVSSPVAMAGSSERDRQRAWATAGLIEDSHKDWDSFRT
eukprot:TRINITY_DN49364_c0_g1_i1.p1 TRINITY_DN49364_c0_g1~~TRINITY_DN49364_c0_g1_i1.p1  ORF type:complete len:633 (-),score=71.63 TRINITY_DN49364_c0_g1_i1:53-1918(-)